MMVFACTIQSIPIMILSMQHPWKRSDEGTGKSMPGEWLEQYGESIYNAGKPDVALRFRSGIITQNDEKIFLHFFKAPGKTEIIIEGFVPDFKTAYFFDDPQKKEIQTDIYHNTIILNLPQGLKPDPDKIVVIEYQN